ncbi:MAG: hypothetical protein AAGG44_09585 [Planctomycetota bacterium]
MQDSVPSEREKSCPRCDAKLRVEDVLCIACGFHLEKEELLAPAVPASTTTDEVDANPFRPTVIPTTDDSGFSN